MRTVIIPNSRSCNTHSSVIAWRIPGTEEPGGLLSMGSHRVGHDWSDLAAAGAATLRWVYMNKVLEQCVVNRKQYISFLFLSFIKTSLRPYNNFFIMISLRLKNQVERVVSRHRMVEGEKKKKNMLGTKLSLLLGATCLFHIWFIFCTIDRLSYLLYYHNRFSKVYMTYICHFKSNFKFLSGSVCLAQLPFPYSYF